MLDPNEITMKNSPVSFTKRKCQCPNASLFKMHISLILITPSKKACLDFIWNKRTNVNCNNEIYVQQGCNHDSFQTLTSSYSFRKNQMNIFINMDLINWLKI